MTKPHVPNTFPQISLLCIFFHKLTLFDKVHSLAYRGKTLCLILSRGSFDRQRPEVYENDRYKVFSSKHSHIGNTEDFCNLCSPGVDQCCGKVTWYLFFIVTNVYKFRQSPTDSKFLLLQIMAYRMYGNKSLPTPMMTKCTDEYMRHRDSMV